jgi:hypothetical protein
MPAANQQHLIAIVNDYRSGSQNFFTHEANIPASV